MHALAPGNIGTVLNPTLWFNTSSTSHRVDDLSSIWPDVVSHPLLGRGYGTIDVSQPDQFRILDDQYLSILWQTGGLGVLAYVWMILAPVIAARKARRSRDPELARAAIAASAGCVAFLVVNALFDAFTYSQVPYLFFILAAMCTVASATEQPEPVRAALRIVRQRRLVPA
jgi:O-antigen ligase